MTASAYKTIITTEKYIILKLNYNIHLTITVWRSCLMSFFLKSVMHCSFSSPLNLPTCRWCAERWMCVSHKWRGTGRQPHTYTHICSRNAVSMTTLSNTDSA